MTTPRFHARREFSPAFVARVLYEAEIYGDEIAAQRVAKHRNTVRLWRRDYITHPDVVAALDAIRREVRKTWIAEAVEARTTALRKVSELVRCTKSLRAAASAAATLHEIILSHQVLGDPEYGPDGSDGRSDHGDPDGDHQHQGDRQRGDQREVEGASGGALIPDDTDDLGGGEG